MRLNVADMLRAELLNYELAIQHAESRIAYFSAVMARNGGSESARKDRRFVYAKVARETWTCFRDDLLKAKTSLEKGIDNALGSYPAEYRAVFRECLLEGREPAEASERLGMTETAVRRIYAKLRRDLHTLYRP